MLVLTRKIGEKILIGDDIAITVVRIHHDKVRIGVEAPAQVVVHREEVRDRLAGAAPPLPTDAPRVMAADRGESAEIAS